MWAIPFGRSRYEDKKGRQTRQTIIETQPSQTSFQKPLFMVNERTNCVLVYSRGIVPSNCSLEWNWESQGKSAKQARILPRPPHQVTLPQIYQESKTRKNICNTAKDRKRSPFTTHPWRMQLNLSGYFTWVAKKASIFFFFCRTTWDEKEGI